MMKQAFPFLCSGLILFGLTGLSIAAPKAPAPGIKVVNHKIILAIKPRFIKHTEVHQDSIPQIEQLAQYLSSHPKLKLRIESHTDSRGSNRFNLVKTQKRADAIRRLLIKFSVKAHRLVAKGYGESRPIASNRTRAGRAKNQRVEFHIIGKKK